MLHDYLRNSKNRAYKYCMFFIRNNPMADPPWSVHNPKEGTIVDKHGRLVAVVTSGAKDLTVDSSTVKVDQQFVVDIPNYDNHNELWVKSHQNLIACAPELLAALKEAAYHLDVAGVPLNQKYYDLINRASYSMKPVESQSDKQDTRRIQISRSS